MSDSWFQKAFGFVEGAVGYEDLQGKLRVDENKLYVDGIERPFVIGTFSTPTLRALRQATQGIAGPGARDGAPRVTHLAAPNGVLPLFADHDKALATFQVASQFNCLEMPAPEVVPEDGITSYAYDHTQGPACSLAAAPATLFRNYAVPVPREMTDADAPGVGQRRDRQLNLLRPLADTLGGHYFDVVNGYFNTTAAQLRALNKRLAEMDPDELLGAFAIGVQDDTEVLFTSGETILETRPLVTQCFCSALSIAYSRAQVAPGEWKPLARLVLRAAYEATAHAAILNAERHGWAASSRQIFFTLVGGGVFGNNLEWIVDALVPAAALAHSMGMEAVLVHHAAINREVKVRVDDALAAHLRQ